MSPYFYRHRDPVALVYWLVDELAPLAELAFSRLADARSLAPLRESARNDRESATTTAGQRQCRAARPRTKRLHPCRLCAARRCRPGPLTAGSSPRILPVGESAVVARGPGEPRPCIRINSSSTWWNNSACTSANNAARPKEVSRPTGGISINS